MRPHQSFVAFLLQSSPDPGTTPWIIGTMAAAISTLATAVGYLGKTRIDRCEQREDKFLEVAPTQVAALQAATAQAARATDLAEKAVNASGNAVTASVENGKKIDALTTAVSSLSLAIAELRTSVGSIQRSLDDIARDRGGPTRR